MECFFEVKKKKYPDAWKNGIQWGRDQEDIADVSKSHIRSQWISAKSFWQQVAKHCQPGNMWPNSILK